MLPWYPWGRFEQCRNATWAIVSDVLPYRERLSTSLLRVYIDDASHSCLHRTEVRTECYWETLGATFMVEGYETTPGCSVFRECEKGQEPSTFPFSIGLVSTHASHLSYP